MSKRGITIVVVVILGALALATWGGTRLGDTSTPEPPEEASAEVNTLTEELAQARDSYVLLQQDNENLKATISDTEATLLETQTLYELAQLENSGLRQTNTELSQENAALKTQNANLEAKIASIESSLTGAQSDYLSLQQTNDQLRSQLTSKTNELSRLQNSYDDLSDDYYDLQAELSDAESDYYDLNQRYQSLENAKHFTVDNRLRVDLSTEQQSGGTTWVRGEVTNISSQTIGRIYVVVSRYAANGTLASMDLPPSVILNLGPNDVGYFSYFTTGELTEITVYGDY